jgi:hypothetical protein
MSLTRQPSEVVESFVLDEKLVNIERVRPKRPNVGTLGKKIKLLANMYPMSFPAADCYHYGR